MLPVIYINLASDGDRRLRMEQEFARLGVPAERFEATRWTELDTTAQAALYSPALNARQHHKPLVNGEKGCYASHLRAWASLLDSDHPALVVLEDDVRLLPDFVRVIEAIAAAPRDWDMIKLIGRNDLGRKEKISHQQELTPGFQLLRYRRIPSLTAGYVISRSGARKLLDSRRPFGRPIDVDLRYFWENQLVMRGLMPAIIALDDSSQQSSIGAKVDEGHWQVKWKKFRLKAAYSWQNRRHARTPG